MEGSISAIMQELLCMFEVNELRWLGLNLQVFDEENWLNMSVRIIHAFKN